MGVELYWGLEPKPSHSSVSCIGHLGCDVFRTKPNDFSELLGCGVFRTKPSDISGLAPKDSTSFKYMLPGWSVVGVTAGAGISAGLLFGLFAGSALVAMTWPAALIIVASALLLAAIHPVVRSHDLSSSGERTEI